MPLNRWTWLVCLLTCAAVPDTRGAEPTATPPGTPFTVDLTSAHHGFDGTSCWVHARAGTIPASEPGNGEGSPLVVMTMQKLLLSGSDVFYALNELRSSDGGTTWTKPVEQVAFVRQTVSSDKAAPLPTGAQIAPQLLRAGDETTVCDFTPKWHTASKTLLGTGQTVWYRDNKVMSVRPRGVAYAAYDASQHEWRPWRILDLPNESRFQNAGAGSGQRCDLENGDILIGVYHTIPGGRPYSTTVFRCRFDGEVMRTVEQGNSLSVDVKRGLYEPSLVRCGGKFFLTLRNDERGYVAVSEDGLNYAAPRPWTFDDGQDLGNYNTQQHWVTHGNELYLVYTRRGAKNDHVFRHRAPLFIGRVDQATLQVVRSSERVLIPERGARLGNFGVCEVRENEVWVIASEWMQPKGSEKYGSDNSVWIAKLRWP